jgi:hypothetical protein
MSEKTSLPRVAKVKSTTPVSDLDAFDMMSRFLAAEKAKQLSHDSSGQTYLASSSQTWNDLRLACNSLLDDNDPRREPVPDWKDETGDLTTTGDLNTTTTSPSPPKTSVATTTPATEKSVKKEARRSEKKEKKEAKSAKKEVKKAKKEAKKEKKKSSKKRKHEEEA